MTMFNLIVSSDCGERSRLEQSADCMQDLEPRCAALDEELRRWHIEEDGFRLESAMCRLERLALGEIQAFEEVALLDRLTAELAASAV
jgi:hypothetical protein